MLKLTALKNNHFLYLGQDWIQSVTGLGTAPSSDRLSPASSLASRRSCDDAVCASTWWIPLHTLQIVGSISTSVSNLRLVDLLYHKSCPYGHLILSLCCTMGLCIPGACSLRTHALLGPASCFLNTSAWIRLTLLIESNQIIALGTRPIVHRNGKSLLLTSQRRTSVWHCRK